jgi:hypothetical protein
MKQFHHNLGMRDCERPPHPTRKDARVERALPGSSVLQMDINAHPNSREDDDLGLTVGELDFGIRPRNLFIKYSIGGYRDLGSITQLCPRLQDFYMLQPGLEGDAMVTHSLDSNRMVNAMNQSLLFSH